MISKKDVQMGLYISFTIRDFLEVSDYKYRIWEPARLITSLLRKKQTNKNP